MTDSKVQFKLTFFFFFTNNYKVRLFINMNLKLNCIKSGKSAQKFY